MKSLKIAILSMSIVCSVHAQQKTGTDRPKEIFLCERSVEQYKLVVIEGNYIFFDTAHDPWEYIEQSRISEMAVFKPDADDLKNDEIVAKYKAKIKDAVAPLLPGFSNSRIQSISLSARVMYPSIEANGNILIFQAKRKRGNHTTVGKALAAHVTSICNPTLFRK